MVEFERDYFPERREETKEAETCRERVRLIEAASRPRPTGMHLAASLPSSSFVRLEGEFAVEPLSLSTVGLWIGHSTDQCPAVLADCQRWRPRGEEVVQQETSFGCPWVCPWEQS